MFRSLLLLSIFVGLVSMVLPEGRRNKSLALLLMVIMLFSVASSVLRFSVEFPLSEDLSPTVQTASPERAALHFAVRERVRQFTGSEPISVESDLDGSGEDWHLTEILVVIATGNSEEVLHDLQQTFSFDGFRVRTEKDT